MKKNWLSTLFTVLLTAFSTLVLTLAVLWFTQKDALLLAARIMQVRTLIEDHAVFDFSKEDAENYAMLGYLTALDDQYTYFWSQEEYQAYLAETEGHFSGIGIVLQAENILNHGIFIYQVKGNSPAESAGIHVGDIIVGVNGESILGKVYEDVYNDLQGEAGQTVAFTIQRGEEQLTIEVEYQDFVQTYVESHMIDSVGYIRIHSFMPPALGEFESALNSLLEEGATSFVFDLRYNLGGSLDVVQGILDLLIPEEEMVIIKYKNDEEIIRSRGLQKTTAPMVVLINESSASASELMASCLRDVNGAVLVGVQSYGKGIGQTTFILADGSAVKMTTFHYLTKARVAYDGIGLVPDITCALDEEQIKYFYALTEADDPQLQAALQAFPQDAS